MTRLPDAARRPARRSTPQRPEPVPGLAASWYVALRSRELTTAPRPLRMFGRDLVAWRAGGGRPVVMARRCPHMGASLAGGTVVDGTVRCPFHHWRFDSTGACVDVPALDRVPATARVRTYPTAERHGYVWAWYGSTRPQFPLPTFPALDGDRRRTFTLTDTTRATVRRVMENTYDPDHLVALHGLPTDGPIGLRLLDDPAEVADHGSRIAPEAWLGAELRWPRYVGVLGHVSRLLGTDASRYTLHVDGWPSGQRITYRADGVVQYRLLLATTPVEPNVTVQRITARVVRHGRGWRDRLDYLAHRIEVTAASNQDLPIFDTIEPGDRHGLYLQRDRGVLHYRKHHQAWVDRVAADA